MSETVHEVGYDKSQPTLDGQTAWQNVGFSNGTRIVLCFNGRKAA